MATAPPKKPNRVGEGGTFGFNRALLLLRHTHTPYGFRILMKSPRSSLNYPSGLSVRGSTNIVFICVFTAVVSCYRL
ncbi:hypothetical protein FKM82_010478 [Ascaphus truei]